MGRFMFQADNRDIGSVKFEGGDGNKDILIPKEGGTLATETFVTNSAEIITAGTGLQKSGTTLNFYPFGLTTASTELTTSDYVVVSDSTTPKKITIANFANELPLLGVGQTWQDVTTNRTSGVTYTNTSGKTIEVIIEVNTDFTSTSYEILYVDGMRVSIFGNGTNTTSIYGTISAIVPNGSTYRMDSSGSAFWVWMELR